MNKAIVYMRNYVHSWSHDSLLHVLLEDNSREVIPRTCYYDSLHVKMPISYWDMKCN